MVNLGPLVARKSTGVILSSTRRIESKTKTQNFRSFCAHSGRRTGSSWPVRRCKTTYTSCGRCSTFCCRTFSATRASLTIGSTPRKCRTTTTWSTDFTEFCAPFCCGESSQRSRNHSCPRKWWTFTCHCRKCSAIGTRKSSSRTSTFSTQLAKMVRN